MSEAVPRDQAQAFLAAAIEQSPSGILIARAPEVVITYANPAALRIRGRTAAALIGAEPAEYPRAWSICLPDGITPYPAEELPLVRAVRNGECAENVEAAIRRDDGEVRWVLANAAPIRDPAGKVVAGIVIFHDITDRKNVEHELRESRNMLRTILDTIAVRVFWKDLDLNYLGGNLAFARDAGLQSPEQLVGLSDHQMVWTDQVAMYHEEDRRIIETGEPILHLDEPQTRPDGGQMWVRASMFPLRDSERRILGVLGTYEDVTERRQAEEAVRRAKEEWERTFDAVPDLIAIIDLEHRVLQVNRPLAEQIGRTPEQCVGELCHTLLHDTPLPLGSCPGRETVADGRIHRAEVFEERQGRHYMITTVPLPDAEGRVTRFLQLTQDVTERRKAEKERRRLEAHMLQAQKLESLGVLAGGVAHDFNNLLMAVLGNAELALHELPPGSPAARNVREIEAAARRAAELSRQMLAFTGKGRLEVRPVALEEAVREMAHILGVSLSRKVELQFRFAAGLPPAAADPAQLRQVILNLIINASEAIGDRQGTITLTTGRIRLEGAVEVWPGGQPQPGEYVFLEVADTGCGMDSATRERIFDPFFSTKFTGRGLGLAVVLGIVRGHGGAIRVTSEPGRGASFRVFLPVAGPAPASAGSEKGTGDWRGSGTILLAEDEETVRAVTARLLERLGFRVLPAADGQAAVELLAAHSEKLAAAVLDLAMPRLDGAEALQAIRRLRPDLPVLLTSGYDERVAAGRLAQDPRVDFIQKPYELPAFAEQLRQLLEPK